MAHRAPHLHQARIDHLAMELQYWLHLNPDIARETDPDKRISAFADRIRQHLDDFGLDLLTEDD